MAHLLALDCAETQSLAPRLKNIVSPTAILWGESDPFLSVGLGERLCSSIPRSTFEVIPDARHFVPEEAAHRVAATIAKLLMR
jgi:pimeloyl-ACP methyl ester carboxylesterase